MSGTLTGYEQLKAYWFNPKAKKVELKLRPTRQLASNDEIAALTTRLQAAREKLSGQR